MLYRRPAFSSLCAHGYRADTCGMGALSCRATQLKAQLVLPSITSVGFGSSSERLDRSSRARYGRLQHVLFSHLDDCAFLVVYLDGRINPCSWLSAASYTTNLSGAHCIYASSIAAFHHLRDTISTPDAHESAARASPRT
ncbi:hypothetical protein CF326_g8255 [Tilletia indica]|nr:hypothetical protein CF326_g8255 [Tilletia indica]